jgi:uncharacterized protein
MLFLLSPAKTLDYDTPTPAALRKALPEPAFAADTAELIAVLRKKTPLQVAALMDLSSNLSALNVARYAAWQPVATCDNSKPAVLAFDGDVYAGLGAKNLSLADLRWLDRHAVILSGLYGAMRPLDALQPYRLEMGTALKTTRGKDLYAFWGDRVTHLINQRQAGEAAPVVVNLASIEYARVVQRAGLRARVIDCVFEEGQANGDYKVISFFAKKARGLMLRFAVQQRLRTAAGLRGFDVDGYSFAASVSTPDRWVFRRVATRPGVTS